MIKIVGLSSACVGIAIAIFNRAMTDDTRNLAARIAWLLIGLALGAWVFGGIWGLLHELDAGVAITKSRNGTTTVFDRDEHPLLFGLTFIAQALATGFYTFLSALCFWKAFKKG
jgi:hypothetical protein